mmetsp:Transcript_27125/g.58104  ORF Transcript_27125/g.58104 Transcript_27125/m.58104 type:complete len:85 (-) Transcript_27125:117-371(-)
MNIFEKKSNLSRGDIFSTYLNWFYTMVVQTTPRAEIVAYLHEELPFIVLECRGKGRLEDMLTKVETSDCKIYCIKPISSKVYKQ